MVPGVNSKNMSVMNNIRPPDELKLTGNVHANWKAFRQSFELYLLAIGLDERNDRRKIALLLTVAGRAALDVYNTFVFSEDERDTLPAVLSKFEDYCTPRKNETYERYVFRNRMQKETESIEQYVTDLRLKSQSCNFGTLCDSMIRDQIVIGVQDKRVRMQLLKETELTIEKAVGICQAAESTKMQLKSFENESETAAVETVQKHKKRFDKRQPQTPKWKSQGRDCERCGSKHAPKECPAYGKECRKCGGRNHFARSCFTKKKVHVVGQKQEESDSEDGEPLFVDAAILTNMNGNDDEWIAPLMVDGVTVPMKIDTGAQVNVLPKKYYNKMTNKPKVRPKKLDLRAFNDQPIPHKGVFRARLSGEGRTISALFVLVEEDRQPIIGLKASEGLGLIKRVHVIDSALVTTRGAAHSKQKDICADFTKEIESEYKDVFQGIGCLPNQYKIRLKENAEPVIHAARKVPLALKEKLRKELQSLIDKGIVRKVEKPTDWVNSLVIVEKKNGDLRLCIDPRDLNKWIKREHYRLPTKSDITSAMAGAQFFSKLDASSGFYQVKLDEESALLCTFNTPFGRHCFLRMPFGIASAPEVFHRTVQQIFDGMEGVGVFLDDVVVWGATRAEHDERLRKVMARVRETGMKLNKQKCQFGVRDITYLGDRISAAGIQPDPEKIRAIKEMPQPKEKTELQRALGLVNYVGRFIPNLSAKTKALRSLLESGTDWRWEHEHVTEWDMLKNSLVKGPVLKFFDPELPVKVSTDASKDGLGAVLLQKHDLAWFPVAYASRTMTEAERNYAQIEKETLGAVFGCEKFHEYIYGREVVLETDHKPLIAISGKALGDAPPRIQRLMLRLQKYSLKFEFTPGKHLVMADALSRASLSHTGSSNTENDVQVHIDCIQKHLPVSADKWRQIAEATADDRELKEVIEKIHLPRDQKLSNPYQSFKDELSVVHGVLLRGERIVIPTSLRSQMAKLAHEGHLGIEKCKRRARVLMYWPHMNRDIEALVQRCETCQRHRYQQPKEPLMAHDKPEEPWRKVGTDLFHLAGRDYLVIMDYKSNYPELAMLTSTTAQHVIKHTKAIFARHGIPVTVVSDNGPQFSSQDYRDFAETYGFEHVTSSPLYPQSNGLAEKGVQIVKRLIKKAAETGEDPYLALLNYRASPLECGRSPSEILMNRKLRTRLPSAEHLLQRRHEDYTKSNSQSKAYDRNAKPLCPLEEKDTVRVRCDGKWGPVAKVIKETTPRSYEFFKETSEMNRKLQKEHDNIRKNFTCDKSTPLHSLLELLQGLERERERFIEQKEKVQQLVVKSKNIIRLKPRNPEEKVAGQRILVRALCDFRQDEKTIYKGDEGILKDNSERTTWQVTGPGGMDMQVPSVCLIVPPPNPLAVSLANKNSQYYEAILSVWNQLYINVKSMISWQYCMLDIQRINSLTLTMLSKMGPDEYNNILKSLEMHFQEFKKHSKGSELFGAEDHKVIETQITVATEHYDELVVQLPTYTARGEGSEYTVAVSVKMLNDLNALQLKLDGTESFLNTFLYIPLGENAPEECSRHITATQAFQKDLASLRGEFVRLKDDVQDELKDADNTDKAKYLRSQLDIINQRLLHLETYNATHLQRLNSLRSLLKGLLQVDDIVKVYEARLTEKETASLDPEEIKKYQNELQIMHTDIEQKKEVLDLQMVELNKIHELNEQRDQSRYRCVVNTEQYAEHVNQLSDRWKRIQVQISNRYHDLDAYVPKLKQYLLSSSQLSDWINQTQRHIDTQQAIKTDDNTVYTQLLNQQKALNSEIKAKRELLETVQKDGNDCINAIKNYELELASYSAGLETLLNIPIKRTVLQSPSSAIVEEVSSLNAHYLELLTRSSDFYKLLMLGLKNMEELKIRNTRIELLEDELQELKDAIRDHSETNAALQKTLSKYKKELSDSQDHLLSLEEVKRSETLKCMATQESLDTSKSRLQELMEEIRRLKLQLEEVERKKTIADERYTFLREEYDETMSKKLKELEQASWAKLELEKTVSERTKEVERLRKELEEESQRVKEAQMEIAKVRQLHSTEMQEVKQTFESQILVTQTNMQKLSQQQENELDAMRLEYERLEGESRDLKEQLQRLRLSLSQEEVQRKHLEGEVQKLSSAGTEEGRKRHELESQVQLMLSQNREAENKWKEVQQSSNRTLQEKNTEINKLTRSLEEERRLKRALEAEKSRLEKEMGDLKSKNEASGEELVKLRSSHQELSLIRVELEAHALEKGRSEQTIVRLQTRIQELQEELKRLESELEKQRRVGEEETGKRRKIEMQLEKTNQTMREYTTTINTLRKSQEETNVEAKQADDERKRLQEALDRSLKENKATSQSLAALKAEMTTLKLQLTQEQGRVQDSNQRYEALRRSTEEKTSALNVSTSETQRLQRLNETLTKDRNRLEEELRRVHLEGEELLKSKKNEDRGMAEQIALLQKQLEASQRASTEHDRLMRQLSREREKLQLEIEHTQKQASETSSIIQTSQSQCIELQKERDDLITRMKSMEQDMKRLKGLEEELLRFKLSAESETRLKLQLQEDNEKIKKDFAEWKSKCETHENKIRQLGSERSAMESQLTSVKSEMERLRAQLKEDEERYRVQSQTWERERVELQVVKESQQNKILTVPQKPDGANKYTQTDQLDSSNLVFDGVRKKVTAQQLQDCGVIDKVTIEQLLNGQRTIQDVAVDIRLNLKGTGAIAGLAGGPKGKLTFTEAKKQKLLSDESGNMLLEAQAATGHIIDPRANVRMTVEEACLNGLVDESDKKLLLTAEAACVGFRDPKTGKLLSASKAMRKGIIEMDTALRLLQAQEAAGGILDPTLSVYLSKDAAMDRELIDEDLYQALNARPECYVDPDTNLSATYVTLKKRCKADLSTGLLLLPAPEKPITVQGLRAEVNVTDLVDAKLLDASDMDQLREGKITSQDIEQRLRAYLRDSTCIAGVYDEANNCTLTIYQSMKNGLLRPGTTLELLEAQAASGFMIDPIHNEYYTVEEACKKGLVGVEFKDKLLSAERAVTGYKHPGTNKIISLFEAIEQGIIEKGHGIRLLEAQIASGGIIDPEHSHRIDVDVAYQRGYFGKEMNQILKDEGDDTKGFFDPNTEENLTYLQLKSRCTTDKKTGLVLLPLHDKKKTQQKNSMRKRRVLIIDPETNKEMTCREAYDRQLIDYETFLELSQQECEWEETVITASDGSSITAIMDMKTGTQYDLKEMLKKGVIDQDVFNSYRSGNLTLTQLADLITSKLKNISKPLSPLASSSSYTSQVSFKSQTFKTETIKSVETVSTQQEPSSINTSKHVSSMSIKLAPLLETVEEQNPVGAIFDTEKLEKITVCDALKRGIIDSITAQRLLEAQACTGGIVNPENGRRVSIQEATRLGVIDDDMANRVKPAQKAYIGFEDVKSKRKMSAAEAVKEKWLPYEAGQRFLEFQYLTGGLFDPEHGTRRSLDEALQLGWIDMRQAQKLQDTRHHPKTLTCPKTKLRISYKEALEGCMNEENTEVRMLPAATVSSRGISSPYNLSNPGSASGSRSGSRRGSVDYDSSSSSKFSSFSYNKTSFSTSSLS